MASAGSNGLLFINLSNKAASPSKSSVIPPLAGPAPHPHAASQPPPLQQAAVTVPGVPVQRYSHSIAAAAADSNKSPKRIRGDPAPATLFFPRKSKIYPIMASPPLSVSVTSPAPSVLSVAVQLAGAPPAPTKGDCEYEVSLPRVAAVVAEAPSVSTRWESCCAPPQTLDIR